jgi:hypothetical protein
MCRSCTSQIEIQIKLVRNRPQVYCRQFALSLAAEPGRKHIGGEDVALQKPPMVPLECVEHLTQ